MWERRVPLLLAVAFAAAALASEVAGSWLARQGADVSEAIASHELAAIFVVGALLLLVWMEMGLRSAARWQRWGARCDGWIAQREPVLAAGLTAVFSLTWAWASVVRHQRFNSMGYDLGIQDQVVWSLSRLRGFAASIEVSNYLGDHFSPALVLLAPLYWLWEDPRILVVTQACWLALGIPATWRITRAAGGGPGLAGLLAVGYALTPAVGFAAKYDFHIITLAVPILLWSVLAYVRGWKWRWLLLLVLSLSIREELGLSVAGFGALALFRPRWRLLGGGLLALGLAYSFLALFEWIPHFRGFGSDTLRRYSYLGVTGHEILAALVREPWSPLVRQLPHSRRVVYFLQLGLPTGGLGLLAPAAWIPGLPNLAQNFASDNLAQASIYFHYSASYLPFVIWAGIQGAIRGWKRAGTVGGRGIVVLLLAWGTVSANVMDRALVDPVRPPYSQVYGLERITDGAAYQTIRNAILPQDRVLASEPFAAHLSQREGIYVLHTRQHYPKDVDWVLVDLGSGRYREDRGWLLDVVLRFLDRGYRIRAFQSSVVVLSRVGGEDENAKEAWERWRRSP
ncbi:MAG: DUF2079 domain-containing protein, partial [Candidatus Eisenbacteria bacterium]|nr:DUF2079 domain-containing protein [Candidatus Eisenbacteria bacterium]